MPHTGFSFGMGMGKGKLKFQYMNGDDDVTEKTQTSIGYDHKFSKMVSGYVMATDGETETATTTTDYSFAGVGLIVKF